ncbi:MAG: right-handed parallel beta-helix repeat-containing protein [Flavobacteriaceae bacterium]|nr:right-handed parallel beta-helix repeat-containing protein [Flavobacteriaceae bacterium]
MRLKLILFSCLFLSLIMFGQQEFHVFPADHKDSPGSASGDGSLARPWDLQTALNWKKSQLKGGYIVWLHGGIYNGRFVSTIQGENARDKIVVSAYAREKVVINGNSPSKRKAVLEVRGSHIVFKNFEITFLGEFPRRQGEKGFMVVDGISHVSGKGCSFFNLKIHNNPGSGIGSWKRTGGTTIENCKIYNNGYFSKVRGSGVGLYVQNASDRMRVIQNNFIFNNYYKGIQVWSASSGKGVEFIKNVLFENNVVFNNGLPAGKLVDNLIIASDDRSGVNRPRNIRVNSNVFYHNTDFNSRSNSGNAPSVTLGYNARAPIEDVSLNANIIIGKNNALRILHAKSLSFENNTIYAGYVHFNSSVLAHINSAKWKFSGNRYFTKRNKAFRISRDSDYTIDEWQKRFGIDSESRWNQLSQLELKPVLFLNKNHDYEKAYDIAVFDKLGGPVSIDPDKIEASGYKSYHIRNIGSGEILVSGSFDGSRKIEVPMGTFNGTAANFGVYTIEFIDEIKRRQSFLRKLFPWLF